MTTTVEQREPRTHRVHRAWLVAAVTMGALVAAAGFRSSTGALLEPLEMEFGWSRATTSGAVSLNLVVYGLTAPFAAALMERFGVRRVVAAALALVAAGSGLTLVMTSAWQLWLLWGVRGRHRHRGDGPGLRGDRRQPMVRAAPRARDRGVLRRQLDRPAGLPAGDRPPRRGPGWRWAAGLVSALRDRARAARAGGSCATGPPTSAPAVRRRPRRTAAAAGGGDARSGRGSRWRPCARSALAGRSGRCSRRSGSAAGRPTG